MQQPAQKGRPAAGLIDWQPGPDRVVTCPICGDAGPKHHVLTSVSGWSARQSSTWELVACPRCRCKFFPDLQSADYTGAHTPDSAIKFYVEIGAGIDILAASTYVTALPERGRYLEVGCGFGFGLDFARWRGFDVQGVDPSRFACTGREVLDLPILDGYLTAESRLEGGPFDMVVISEVLEHIFDQVEFVRILAAHLKDDGVLMLTTPYASSIMPTTPPGSLMALLSPRYHYALYSEQAVAHVLRAAGFRHVKTHVRQYTLCATASNGEREIHLERGSDHADLCHYLASRVTTSLPDSPLNHGFRYRLLKAHCNAGAYRDALATYEELRRSIRRVYGFDIDEPFDAWFAPVEGEDFHAFAMRYPMCLCGAGYFRGIIALNHEDSPANAERAFAMALAYGSRLRHLLQDIGADDGELEVHVERARVLHLRAIAYREPLLAANLTLQLSVGDPDVAVSDHEFTRGDGDLLDLFSHLANLGALAEADLLSHRVMGALRRLGHQHSGTGLRQAFEVHRALGLVALNHRRAPKEAFMHFAQASRAAGRWAKLTADPEATRARWQALAEQALAACVSGEARRARRSIDRLREPRRNGELAPSAADLLQRLDKQLQDG